MNVNVSEEFFLHKKYFLFILYQSLLKSAVSRFVLFLIVTFAFFVFQIYLHI